ncbi:uncharacterized protein LOC115219182 [Octopus sinensis]|uniref:Uncharacterized protein LOC115219182 n=1 Tax=Octopus sinensis TaxID=2607531 RepID=A0A7E6FB15_9MOLL|nr:uncharacterized protein LOC115219182 [Octopus sinensis]
MDPWQVGNSFNQHSWKGFSAKFHEYSSQSYDLGLYTLDLSNKHGFVFDFQEVALSNYIQQVLKTDNNKRPKNICKNSIPKPDPTADKCMKPPIICTKTMDLRGAEKHMCHTYIKAIKTAMLKFYKCKEPIKPYRALEFLQLSNVKMIHRIITHIINKDDKHITYIMKKVFLNHLHHQVKELTDMTTRLASNDPFIEFLMDKSLRCSQPKYQEFYTV